MKTFLNVIASEYSSRYPDLSRLVFVLPNKRSGSFLLKAFSDCNDNVRISPRILTITDFVADISPLVSDSRIDLLFRLFNIYKNLQHGVETQDFDKFRSWGETIINDFNEIDMQMVDVEALFKNVYDLNAIRSDFLTEEQKKVMSEYFGYVSESNTEDLRKFWFQFDDNNKGLKQRFKSLWQLLHPLYTALKDNLKKDGLTTSGGVYREAAIRIESGFEPLEGDKIIFVGFNALSMAESFIFRALKKMEIPALGEDNVKFEPKADFIWDIVPEIFAAEGGPAMKFVGSNLKKENFPMPHWIAMPIRRSVPNEFPKLKIISVPSNVMQTKVAAMELSTLLKSDNDNRKGDTNVTETIKNAKVAIVLPEENLLSPLLYSLPPEFSKPNLTMGFPLRQTPVISFAFLLKKLHQRSKKSGQSHSFFFEDVKNLLSHPYSRILFESEKINEFIQRNEKERKILVTSQNLESLGNNSPVLFRYFEENVSPGCIIDYIKELFLKIKDEIKEGAKNTYLRAGVENVYIGTYIDALIRLKNCVGQYEIKFKPNEIFNLADRLIGGENVVFDGRPLEGLQVMGVLETRCLDFDKIIMLSVNERVLPKTGRNSTFIPNIIRSAFGMPPANFQEEIFSYYFYRVIGRCREGILTYDSRSSENRSPGPSRYLLQLKHLCENIDIEENEARFDMPRALREIPVVEKNQDIQETIELYLMDDDGSDSNDSNSVKRKNKYFSASGLSHYFRCPILFLYADILGIRVEREKIETIDAIDMGTIVHRIIESLYFPENKRGTFLDSPIVITKDFLETLLFEKKSSGGETRIEKETRKAILKVHFNKDESELSTGKLTGSAAIIFDFIIKYVKNIISADLQRVPFRLWGSEISQIIKYKIDQNDSACEPVYIGMKMVIDRLDQAGESGDDLPFRIVDYKTGSVHLEAESLSDLFDGEVRAQNIFQLLFYAEMLLKLVNTKDWKWGKKIKDKKAFEEYLQLVIYNVPQLPKSNGVRNPQIGYMINEKGVESPRVISTMGEFRMLEQEEGITFLGLLENKIREIINSDYKFVGIPAESRCRFCDYKLRCDIMRAKIENSAENH